MYIDLNIIYGYTYSYIYAYISTCKYMCFISSLISGVPLYWVYFKILIMFRFQGNYTRQQPDANRTLGVCVFFLEKMFKFYTAHPRADPNLMGINEFLSVGFGSTPERLGLFFKTCVSCPWHGSRHGYSFIHQSKNGLWIRCCRPKTQAGD